MPYAQPWIEGSFTVLDSESDGSFYPCLKVLTNPCKIRAPFHDLTSKIPHKTMAGKKKKSRTNPVSQCSCGFPVFYAIV